MFWFINCCMNLVAWLKRHVSSLQFLSRSKSSFNKWLIINYQFNLKKNWSYHEGEMLVCYFIKDRCCLTKVQPCIVISLKIKVHKWMKNREEVERQEEKREYEIERKEEEGVRERKRRGWEGERGGRERERKRKRGILFTL